VINVTGCFLAGVTIAALVDRHHLPGWVRAGGVVGFLGAYTTFSTFAVDVDVLGKDGHLAIAAAYVVASLAVGLVAVVGGLRAGRAVG